MDQENLPFADADAAAIDQRMTLRMAIQASTTGIGEDGDLHLRTFCETVLDYEERGRPFQASYQQIAATPNGLCCSVGKVRTTVEKAKRLGLVRVKDTFDGSSQVANRYWIDWAGVRRALCGPSSKPWSVAGHDDGLALVGSPSAGDGSAQRLPGTPATVEHRGALTEHPGASTAHRGAPTAHRSGDSGNAIVLARAPAPVGELNTNTSGPDPDPGPDRLETCGLQIRGLDEGMLAIPELAAACRRLTPLPANSLYLGVFKPLTYEHISSTLRMVEWHRRQLSAHAPVLGDSEVELLLVVAAARYAVELRSDRVKRSRVAAFIATVGRRKWTRVLGYLPDAVKRLEEAHEYAVNHDVLMPWFAEAADGPPSNASNSFDEV